MKPMHDIFTFLLLAPTFAPLVASWGGRPNQVSPTTLQTVASVTANAASTNVAVNTNTATQGTATQGTATPATASPSPQAGNNGASCIQFTFSSSDDSVTWWVAGTAGNGQTFGEKSPSACLSGSGAMFITTDPSLGYGAGAGNTKFEWTILTSGQSTVDVSVCDGFSVAMSCSVLGTTIGGSNLFGLGNACQYPNGPNCVNGPGGQGSHDNDAIAFFKAGNYWYQDNVFNGVNWQSGQGPASVQCTIG